MKLSKKARGILGGSLIVLAIATLVVWQVAVGDTSWQYTLEDAFADRKQAADYDWGDGQYQVKSTVAKIYYENSAYWLYESESDELAIVGFKYSSEKQKYKYDFSGSFGQIDDLFPEPLNALEGTYSMTLDNENLWGCRPHDGLVPYVNGEKARIYATYDIEYNGVVYSVDWWDVVGFDGNSYDSMKVEFLPA